MVGPRVASSSLYGPRIFPALGSTRGRSVDFLTSNHGHLYYTPKWPWPPGALELIAFNHPLKFQVSNVFPPALIPLVLSNFLAGHVTSHFRLLIVVLCYVIVHLLDHDEEPYLSIFFMCFTVTGSFWLRPSSFLVIPLYWGGATSSHIISLGSIQAQHLMWSSASLYLPSEPHIYSFHTFTHSYF